MSDNMYLKPPYGMLPRQGSSAHHEPETYALRLNQQAKVLDRMDEYSQPRGPNDAPPIVGPPLKSELKFDFLRPPAFPTGSTDPWSAKIKVLYGPSNRIVACVWLTIDVHVWLTVDKTMAPVVYQGPIPMIAGTKRESIVLQANVQRDYPNIVAMIQETVGQAELTMLDEWARA